MAGLYKGLLRIIELAGIQASGKTTWANKEMAAFPNVNRVNKDELRPILGRIRHMFRLGNKPVSEPLVRDAEKVLAVLVIKKYGMNVIVDDTNLTQPTGWKELANRLGVKHVRRFFPVDVDEAIKRDAARTDKPPVGAVAIRATAKRLPKGVRKGGPRGHPRAGAAPFRQ